MKTAPKAIPDTGLANAKQDLRQAKPPETVRDRIQAQQIMFHEFKAMEDSHYRLWEATEQLDADRQPRTMQLDHHNTGINSQGHGRAGDRRSRRRMVQ